MERIFLECQVCLSTFNRICNFKSHVNSSVHQKKMVDVFQQDIVDGYVAIPPIALINQRTKHRQVKRPIIGLSMCFSRGKYGSFYLCHVCEEKINTEKIISHLFSIDHCSNYFNHTNPNALSFSWIPSGDMRHILRPEVTQEGKEKGRSELQMLNLPGNLSTQLKSCTYSEVMDILREKTKLVKQLEVKPKKTMIQTYQRDSNREHPLLGLQHLVECICVGQTERRYYLCTLCHLIVPTRMIIKHVLSFDHIFCYFRVWHPSTLLARESYREYTKSFAAKMLDLAKQTEKIHGTANADMKQVRLEPAKFTSVNFTCYAKALEELGSINKENNESSLITNVTPGNKLEGQCSQQGKMGSCSVSSNSTSSNPASSNLASSNPASSKPASSNLVSSNVASSKPASSNPASSNPASSKASSNPASSKASSSPFSSKASSNPVSSNPVSSNPDSSNPVSSNPASSKPASSNPASSKPASSNPASSKPASSNPANSKPASSNPASSKPVSSNPASSKPASSNPASSKPASSNPVGSNLASSNPASSNLASSNPASSKPASSNPVSSNVASSKPASSNPASSNPAISKASSNPASSKANSSPFSSKASSNPASSKPASSNPASSKPASSNPASSKPASSNPASSKPASSNPVSSNLASSNSAGSNPSSSKASSNLASSNLASSNPASSKGSSSLFRSKASSNPASSNPACSKPASSKASFNPASSNPAGSKASSNPASSNPASSNLASSNPASSNPASSKASSNPASSKASSNPASSNPASSNPDSSNTASSNPASFKASFNPASFKASSSPASSKASSNPASSNSASSNPASSNPAGSKASSNSASSNPASCNPTGSKASSDLASSDLASSNPARSNPASSIPASSNPASSNPATSKASSNPAISNLAISNPAISNPAISNPASSNPASSNSASSSPALTTSLDLHTICYKLRCQNCRKSFRCMSQYCRHVSTWEHKHMLKESRGGEWKPRLGLYKYLIESLRRNHPVIGVPLVVTLVTTQVQNEPLYICFACEDCFSESFVKQHFDSRKHVINTVLYQNPWRLTFAWENHLSMKDLRSMAWEEEMERPNQRMLKILDIPKSLGTLCYRKVMEKLELQHTLLKRDVPKCETYSKLQQNERFPLLGRQFLVMHDICIKGQQTTDVGFLCLLCCRRLSDNECYTHLFSLQHVAEFIDRFHPGSLNSSTDAETVLDLAKQAAYIHPISHVQVMKLDMPIWETCSYFKALSILMTANKGEGKASLQPPIVPGKKLFPRGTLKDVNKDHVRDNNQKNSRMVEGCEETTSQKSTDNSETTLNKMSVVGAGVTSSRCVESGENAEKGDDKETLTPSEKESEKRGGVFSETGSEEKRNAGNESCQAIKEEKIKEPTAGSGEAPESSQNTDKFYPTETGKERSESCKDVPTQLTQKRKVSPCTVEDVEQEMSHKRQRLTSKEDASCEAPQNLTSSKRVGQKEATTADKGESGKKSHETATYEGNVEIDGDSEESKSQPSSVTTAVSAVTETTSNTAKVSPESNEDVRMTCIKVSESADNADTCPCEDKAKIISNTTVGPLKIATTSKIEWTSETAADSTVTTPTTSMTAISKFTAKSSNCAPDTTKSAAPTSKLTAATSSCTTATKKLRETAYACTSTISVCTATTSTSSVTISSVTSITKSATLSKPLERRTGAAAKVTATSYKAAAASNTGSKVAHEAVCRTAPASKVENASKNSENASKTVVASHTVVTSVATAKMTVKGKNTEASVKTAQMKSSVGSTADVAPNIHKAPAALRLIMPKNPPTEPSHNPASKKWQSASPPEVGLNQLMKVKCGEKKQVYCLLCSVRLRGRCHVTDFTHQYNYAKMKSPERVSELKPSELQRELTKLVTLLAEADRDVGSQSFLTVKVNIDDYKELATLSADKAIGRLKAIMRQKDLRVSSTSTTDTDASPCEASSQDDESSSKEEGAPAVGPSDRAQSVKSSEPEANDLIPDQLHSCSISNNNKPNANRSVQDAGIAAVKMVKAKCYVPPLATDAAGSFAKTPDTCQETPEKRQQQERSRPELQDTRKVLEGSQKASTVKLLNPDPLSSAATVNTEQQNKPGPRRRAQDVSEHSQVLPMISILFSNNNKPNANRSVQDAGIAAVKMVKAKCYVPPLATDAAGSFAKTPDTCQETPEKRQQQERSRPELQDTRKVLEGSQKASTVKLLNPDPLSSAATVNTEQQNKPGPRRRAQDVSEHSQVLPMISIGESSEGRSHLSIYLNGHEPIIGLGLMWECRVMTVRTFYLCESCSETLLSRDIVQHMRSDDHQYNFIRMRHPGFLYFWSDELLLPWMKLNILKGIVKKVSKQERFNEMDAQVILLGKEMFKPVWTASFSDALKLVKEIKKQKKLTIPHPSIFSPQQKDKQPESRQSPEESLPTEVQPSQALETDQRSDNGAKQKTEKHPLEEMDGDLDGVKQRSPMDVTRVSPKADPVISPFSGAGTCLSPQEQPEPRPPVSQHQRPIPELQVKQVELHSESPSSSIVCPKTSQTLSVSPRDEYFPTRKRAAVESIETLVRSCTNNPQLEDPLPALCSELQPISAESASESTSVKPAATSTLLSPMDKDTEPGFDEQDIPAVDMEKFDDLMALLRKMKSELNMSPCTSAPGKSETTTSCANNSSASGVERRQDPEPVQTTSNVATKQTRWDSKWQMLKVTKNPPSANSLEMFSTAAPEVLSHDNQLVASNASSVITSSPEGSTLTRGDLLFGATEANAVMQLPSASTADPSDPQNQNDAQSTFGSQPHPSPIYDNPGQIPQPRDNTETDSTGVRQLPINAIVSVRSNRYNQRFMGSYNRQDPTEVNNQVTHSFPTGATVSPSDASRGYGQYRQMAYFANGLSGYFSTEAVGSYTAPANPPVYTESPCQYEGFTTGAPYPSPIYPEQGATRFSLQSFGHILTAPALPEWVKLGLYQQQLLPQQYSSWRSTSLAAGDGTVISEAAYGGAAPVTTPATSSQKMIDLNDYRTLRVAPTQSSSNVAAQNIPQAYVNPPVIHYPPGANTEITSQPPANSFFASGGGFYVVEK